MKSISRILRRQQRSQLHISSSLPSRFHPKLVKRTNKYNTFPTSSYSLFPSIQIVFNNGSLRYYSDVIQEAVDDMVLREDLNISNGNTQIAIGDWVETRSGRSAFQGIILKIFPDEKLGKTTIAVLNAAGAIEQVDANRILFRIPQWSSLWEKVELPETEKKKIVPRLSKGAQTVILEELKIDADNAMQYLSYFVRESEQLKIKRKGEMASMHARCMKAVAQFELKKDSGIRNNVLVKLDDLVNLIFHRGDIRVEPATVNSGYSVVLKVEPTSFSTQSNTPSLTTSSTSMYKGLIETHAVYTYIFQNGGHFFEPYMSKSSDLRRDKMFRVLSHHEVYSFEWIKAESKFLTYFKHSAAEVENHQRLCRALSLDVYKPGEALRSFVLKIIHTLRSPQRSSKSVGSDDSLSTFLPQISLNAQHEEQYNDPKFTKHDFLFFDCIKKVATSFSSAQNPLENLFKFAFLERLKSHRIVPRHMPPRQAAVYLLKALKIWDPSQFAFVEQVKQAKVIEVLQQESNPSFVKKMDKMVEHWSSQIVKGNMISRSQGLKEDPLYPLIKPLGVLPSQVSQQQIQSQISTQDSVESIREEMNGHTVFVIDDAEAKELDDGISIEPIHSPDGSIIDYWLHVHIADPTAYFSPLHPLAVYTQLRSRSIYFPEKHHPMLPSLFSGSAASLKNGAFAMTFSARIGADGDIIDYKITPTIVNNVKQLTYDTANNHLNYDTILSLNKEKMMPWTQKALEKAQRDAHQRQSAMMKNGAVLSSSGEEILHLQHIQEMTIRHQKFRFKNGALDFDRSSTSIHVKKFKKHHDRQEHDKNWSVKMNPRSTPMTSPSQRMVSECMIIAGRVASQFCYDHQLAVPHRSQFALGTDPLALSQRVPILSDVKPKEFMIHYPVPADVMVQELRDIQDTQGFVDYWNLLRVRPYMNSSVLSSLPLAHFSMGIPGISPEDVKDGRTAISSFSQLNGYLQVTSPLRKYMDMFCHWQIKSALLLKSLKITKDSPSYVFNLEDLRKIVPHQYNIEKRVLAMGDRALGCWTAEWCRRRELMAKTDFKDPVDMNNVESVYLDPVNEPGFEFDPMMMMTLDSSSADSNMNPYTKINRFEKDDDCHHYEGHLLSEGLPIYSCQILTEDSASHFSDLQVVVHELGGSIARLAVSSPEERKRFSQGDVVKCMIKDVNPDFNSIVMTIVQ